MADNREIEKEPPCITCMQEPKLKFILGEKVMVKDGVKTEGGKVVPILNGPYIVVEQTSPVKFKLRKKSKSRFVFIQFYKLSDSHYIHSQSPKILNGMVYRMESGGYYTNKPK